jgi:hypothetical protein
MAAFRRCAKSPCASKVKKLSQAQADKNSTYINPDRIFIRKDIWFLTFFHAAGSLHATTRSACSNKILLWPNRQSGVSFPDFLWLAERLNIEGRLQESEVPVLGQSALESLLPQIREATTLIGCRESIHIHLQAGADMQPNSSQISVNTSLGIATMRLAQGVSRRESFAKEMDFSAHFLARLCSNISHPELPIENDVASFRMEKLERLRLHILKLALGTVASARNYAACGV